MLDEHSIDFSLPPLLGRDIARFSNLYNNKLAFIQDPMHTLQSYLKPPSP